MANQPSATRSTASIWMQAVRAFSFTASMVPVLLGAALALSYHGPVMWGLFPLVIVCSLLFHAGTNLVSDYFDYKRGVDREGTLGSSGVLVGKLLQPAQVLRAGLLCFALGFLLGLVLVYYRGTPILTLGIIGLLGGYLYTGNPFGYKYIALGDLLVFALMGPLMVIGSYLTLTGEYMNTTVWLVSLPIGFLVTAILNANNLRDIADDTGANIKTLATVLGLKAAKAEYFLLVMGAYLTIIALVVGKVLAPWTLVIVLSLPVALKNMKTIGNAEAGRSQELAMIDVQTAQFHFLFGLLLIIGVVLSHFL